MRLAFDRFTVVLDACVLFPMIVRDILLTLADHDLFNPKWSERIHQEWTSNLIARRAAVGAGLAPEASVRAVRQAMDRAFPDALVHHVAPESNVLHAVDPKDRHVVLTAVAIRADAIVTFNMKDFAAEHLRTELEIEVIHPDQFVLDLIDLDETRAVASFKALRNRKKNPPWSLDELAERAMRAGLPHTALWLETEGIRALV